MYGSGNLYSAALAPGRGEGGLPVLAHGGGRMARHFSGRPSWAAKRGVAASFRSARHHVCQRCPSGWRLRRGWRMAKEMAC